MLLTYFFQATFVVKVILLILLSASIASWTAIFHRQKILKGAKKSLAEFESTFWSADHPFHYYRALKERASPSLSGIEKIFIAGFEAFLQQRELPPDLLIASVQRAIRSNTMREYEQLGKELSLLATVGSFSPYVGLLGTVWGIMHTFHALGTVQQPTLSAIAPGISEALFATAMGLLAAIPAVIAYNRFTTMLESIENHYEIFEEEFLNLLHHEIQSEASKS